jgi:hypothetical protein
MGRFLKYDYLSAFVSGGFWILLSFWDLRKDGRLHASWMKILSIMGVVTVLFGPGTMMAVVWAWREEILARSFIDHQRLREDE